MDADALQELQDAIRGILPEGELVVHWVLAVDVAKPDGSRYLAHRYGGGVDGQARPQAWQALGMLQASVGDVEEQLRESTRDAE